MSTYSITCAHSHIGVRPSSSLGFTRHRLALTLLLQPTTTATYASFNFKSSRFAGQENMNSVCSNHSGSSPHHYCRYKLSTNGTVQVVRFPNIDGVSRKTCYRYVVYASPSYTYVVYYSGQVKASSLPRHETIFSHVCPLTGLANRG
jgi:hypothetical protein